MLSEAKVRQKYATKFSRLDKINNEDDSSDYGSDDSLPNKPSTSGDLSNSTSPLYPMPNGYLMGSLVREEGHIYSLATSGDLLYTGSDSRSIRIWQSHKEIQGLRSKSGLIKDIKISGDKIFTGHQDGKIRIWKVCSRNPTTHKKIGVLPTLKAYVRSSLKASNYVEVRRNRNTLWLRHCDAISCLGLSEDQTILYSSSWDKTLKVWRILDFKCLESINAHNDAINAVVTAFDGLVLTGSADGSVKVWRREMQGKGTKHFFSQTLLKQECAVTTLAVNPEATVIYSGSSDGVVNFWEREREMCHGGTLRGHKLAILCLATAGSLVLSGSADMGICVWVRKGEDDGFVHSLLAVMTGHSGPVKCLAIEGEGETTPTGRRYMVYSGSLDRSVKMWMVSEGEGDGGKEMKTKEKTSSSSDISFF